MPSRKTYSTDAAPQAIGAYSQAARGGDLVFISGQIPLRPDTQEFVAGDFRAQARQVFENVRAIVHEAGGSMDDVIKVTVYLVSLDDFATVNEVMGEFFAEPFPARAALGVASLPKGATVEVEAIMHLPG